MNPLLLVLAFSQDPGGCALDVRLPQSIKRYVPNLAFANTEGEGTWKLTVASRPHEVEIVLVDDRAQEQLRRVLRAEAEACAATADGIGLILERYLSDLGYETGFVPLPEIPVAESPAAISQFQVTPELYGGGSTRATIRWSVSAETLPRLEIDGVVDPTFPGTAAGTHTATIAGTRVVSLIAGDARADVRVIGMKLDLDAAFTTEAPNPGGARFGGAFDLALALWLLRFELEFFGLAPVLETPITQAGREVGGYKVWALGGIGRAGVCGDFAPVSICGLVGGGVERVKGSVDGDLLFQRAATVEVGGLVSAGVRAAWEVGLFHVYFRGEAVIRPNRAEFVIGGIQDPYRDSRVAAFLSIGVGIQVF